MKYAWHFIKRLIQNLFLATIMFICSFGFLALCNWDLNPSGWNGFSRFLGAVAAIIISYTTYDAMSSVILHIKDRIANDRARKENERKQKLWQLDEIRPGE